MIPHQANLYPGAQPEDALPPQLHAQRRLHDAIDYASREEFAILVDRELQRGAQLDRDYDFNLPDYHQHLLVVIARANKPWAIPILMARGLRIPVVPADGVDLLMEASRDDQAELVRTLIDVARMETDSTDAGGKTALHYAAFSNAEQCVAILLEKGANPDIQSTAMAPADLELAFGRQHELDGSGITPLMIAAARGNHAIVRQLIDADALFNAGACSPLLIAARNNHPSIMELLLESGVPLPRVHDESGRSGLAALLHHHVSMDCLRVAVRHHDFSSDSGTFGSPLAIAIDQCNPALVSLLLGCGATIEPQSTEDDTLWDLAFLRERNGCQMLDLMAATTPCEDSIHDPDQLFELLVELVDTCIDSSSVAAEGLFPSLLLPAIPALQRVREQKDSLSKRQLALEAAFALVRHLPVRPSATVTTQSAAPDLVDVRWMQHTRACRESQRKALIRHSQRLIDECLRTTAQATTVEFLKACMVQRPAEVSVHDFIDDRLAVGHGIPDDLVQLIASAWATAASRVVEWDVAPDADDEADRFVENFGRNWIRHAIEDVDTDENPLLHTCVEAMTEALEQAPSPLSAFCSNPVSWLRRFEGRNHLRPVDQRLLAEALQIALGLPTSTCTGIASAWREAIDAAQASRIWKTPAELTALLEGSMHAAIDEVMGDDDNDDLVPTSDRRQLSNWVHAARGQAPGGARKRAASNDGSDDGNGDGSDDGASSPKQARH